MAQRVRIPVVGRVPEVDLDGGSGGVNRLADPREIRDDQLVSCKNLLPNVVGRLQTRLARYYTDITNFSDDPWYMVGATPVPFTADYDFLVAYINTTDNRFGLRGVSKTGAITTGGTFSGGVTAASNILPGEVAISPAFLFNNGLAYVCPGAGTGFGIISINSAAVMGTAGFNGTNNTAVRPRAAAWYRSRAVFMNLGIGYENYMVMSAPYDPLTIGADVFSSNARAFTVGAHDGDRLVGGTEVMLTAVGSPAQSGFLVFREYSAYLLTGENPTGVGTDTADSDLVVNKIAFDCGCSSKNTIVTTPYGTIWAGHDDVWLFSQGQIPVRIGSNIRPVLQATPAAERFRWCAAYDNGFYKLSVFSDGRGPNELSFPDEEWCLDLRKGAPADAEHAKWYGPMSYRRYDYWAGSPTTSVEGICAYLPETRVGQEPSLFVCGGVGPFGFTTNAGWVASHADGVADGTGRTDTNLDISYDKQTDQEIQIQLLSKEYDLAMAGNEKLVDGGEVDLFVSEPLRFTLKSYLDNGATTDSPTFDVDWSGFKVDGDTVNVNVLTKTHQAVRVRPASGGRPRGKTFQVELTNNPGILITDTNKYFAWEKNGAAQPSFTFPTGLYATVSAFLDQFKISIAAASGTLVANWLYADVSTGHILIACTSGLTWRPIFQTGVGSYSATELLSTRLLMGSLGFLVNANPVAGASQQSTNWAYWRRNARIEIGRLLVHTFPARRGPA